MLLYLFIAGREIATIGYIRMKLKNQSYVEMLRDLDIVLELTLAFALVKIQIMGTRVLTTFYGQCSPPSSLSL